MQQRKYPLTDCGLRGIHNDGSTSLPGLERYLDDTGALIQQQEAAVVTRRRSAAAT